MSLQIWLLFSLRLILPQYTRGMHDEPSLLRWVSPDLVNTPATNIVQAALTESQLCHNLSRCLNIALQLYKKVPLILRRECLPSPSPLFNISPIRIFETNLHASTSRCEHSVDPARALYTTRST